MNKVMDFIIFTLNVYNTMNVMALLIIDVLSLSSDCACLLF